MAIVSSLAIGNARRSAGNLTFQTVKGRTIAREKPLYVANPQTPAQVAQRSKMAHLVQAWRAFFFQTRPYFTVLSAYGSAYNQFIKLNMPYATNPWYDQLTNKFTLPVNSYVSYGKYGETAVNATAFSGPPDGVRFVVNDLQLKSELLVGDQLIAISNTEPSAGTWVIAMAVKTLTAADVAELQAGNDVEVNIDTTFGGTQFAGIYYSPSRNVSSVARIKTF